MEALKEAKKWMETHGGVSPLSLSTQFIAALIAEVERLTDEHGKACHLVAKMHFAATGSTDGPKRGVVEDIEDLRTKCDRYASALERIDKMVSFSERGCSAGIVAKDALAGAVKG